MEDINESLKYIKQSFELKSQKLYKEAIEVLYKVLTDEANQETVVEVISQIGDLHILLNNFDRAAEQYKDVLEIDPNHRHSKEKLYEIYYQTGEYEKALEITKNICRDSKNPVDFVKYFDVLLKKGRKDDILREYDALDDELKNNSNILYIISLITDGARKKELLEKIVNGSSPIFEAKADLAFIKFEEEEYDLAESLLDEVLILKKDAKCYYYKALIQIKKREFFPAIDNLHLAIKASKNLEQKYFFELAKTYMDVNWFEEAINTIKRSITLCIEQNAPRFEIDKRYLLLAWVFEKQKDYDNALFNLTLIDDNSKCNIQRNILKAVINYKKGNVVKAKDELEEIYERNEDSRNDLTLLDALGNIYKDLKLSGKACDFYKKHLEHYPDSIHTVCEYVDLLIDIREYDKALELIEQYSKKGIIANFLNSLARIHFRKEEYNQTLVYLDRLLSYDKNNAETYYFKGLTLNKTGKYQEAFDLIQTALKLNPMPAKYYAQASKAKLEMGQFDDAMLYIKEAIEIDPDDLNYKRFAGEIAEKSGNEAEAQFWNSITGSTENVIKNMKRL